jgi:hypothetical protein
MVDVGQYRRARRDGGPDGQVRGIQMPDELPDRPAHDKP